LHFTTGSFTDFADFPFGSAKAEGERVTEIARAAITKAFTLTPLDIALMVNRNPEKTLNLFPFNGGRWLTRNIKYHPVDLANLIGYACRNLFKYLVRHT